MAKQSNKTVDMAIETLTVEDRVNSAALLGLEVADAMSVAESLKERLNPMLKELSKTPIKFGRVMKDARKSCKILTPISAQAQAFFRAKEISERMKTAGCPQSEAIAFVDGRKKSGYQQKASNFLFQFKTSVTAGKWLTYREAQALIKAEKTKAEQTVEVIEDSESVEHEESNTVLDSGSGKPTADKLRTMIGTIIAMVQGDETPEGYNPAELVRDLKAALTQIH